MKKNIKKTAVAENVMNSAEPVDMLRNWIGLDQGDKISRYCILNEFSKVVERGSVGTRKEDLKRKFASYAGSVIAIEVGTHSPWISRLLQQMGLDVVIANPRKVKLITQSRKKSDDKDAEDPKIWRDW